MSTPFRRLLGRVSQGSPLQGVVATTDLFGEMATQLDASHDPDPMLRTPRLDIVPARVERASGG